MQALRIFILAAIATAVLAASSSPKTTKSQKTPQLQRRLGLARIELPEPKLKGLAHRLLQVKRGFLSAQVTASDGHLVGLSFKVKHGHKPGYHLNVGQEHSKKGWDGPGYRKKGWDALDSSNLPYSSYSAGPYSSYGSQNYQSMFRGAHGLSLGHASSMYSEGLQSYDYKDAASFGYPFSGYQVPGYVTTLPKLPFTKLVDSVPTVLPGVSGVYDQATLVSAPVQTPTIVQSFPVAKTIGGHAKVPAAHIVHKVPLSALSKKAYAQQQVTGTAHGFHPVLVQKVPVSKLALHVPQSHYVMHTVKPVSSIGVLKTPIYAATGAGELYPIDIDGSTYQEDDAGGAEDVQSGTGYGNGDTAGSQNGESQEGQSNGGGGGANGNGGATASRNGGAFQRGHFNGGGGGGGNYGRGNGAAGGSSSSGFNGGGVGKYGHGNGAAGGFNNDEFNGGGGGSGGSSGVGNYGQGNGATGGSDNGGFNDGGGGNYGYGNGASGGFNNGGFNGGSGGGGGGGGGAGGGSSSRGGGNYGQGNSAAGGSDSGEFSGGGGGKYGYGNGASRGFSNGGFNGGGGSSSRGGGNYGQGNGAAGGSDSGEFNGGGGGKYGYGNGGGAGFINGGFNGGGGGGNGENYGEGNGAVSGFGEGAVQRGHSSSGGGGKYGGGSRFRQGLENSGEGSQEGYGNNVPSGGRGYENGGGTQGFPPGLAHPGGGNGEGQDRNSYSSAGAGPQRGFANGGYQGGNGFSGAAGSGYTNGGFQGPQQHAFPQAVTGFKDVQLLTPLAGGLSQKHGYKAAQPVELVYGGVREGGLQAQIQQYPDIQGPEESIARGQVNRNAQGVGSPRGNENRQEGYKSGAGWKPIIDPRYNAKFNSGSIGSRLRDAPQGDNVLKNVYDGVRANGHSSFNGAADGLVNGDLQVKGSHVQYPKYRYRNQGFFGKSNFQENGGGRKLSEGSGESYFSTQFNGNGGGAGNSDFGSDGNSEFPANGRTKQYNGGEGNGRSNHFRDGGGVGRQQNDFIQGEGSLRNGDSGARFPETSQRGSFQGNGNGRNFGQALPSGRFRGRKNGGGPTPPKFCPKGGWRPIIREGKKSRVNSAQRSTQQVPEGQRNGFRRPNGFEVPGQTQNGDDTMRGRYSTGLNGFQGNGEVYQGLGPTGNGGDSGSYFRGTVGQFDVANVGTSDMLAEIGNGGANAALSNGQSNGFTSQGSLGSLSEPNNGGHRSIEYSNGQGYGGTEAFEVPRQFLNGRAQGVAFSQGSTYYEGEELPGEESFKREEIKKVLFRPAGREAIKVPKSVILSGRGTSMKKSNKSETPMRVLINIDTSISPSQRVTTKEQLSLEQLLAMYKSDAQKNVPLELRSVRGHGYRDVSFSETINTPIQKSSPVDVRQPELVKTVSEGLLTKEVKTESSSDLKKVVVPESVEIMTSTEESSEEQDNDNAPPPAPEPIRSTDSGLPAKELFVSDAGVGASTALVEPSPTKPDSSSSEEVGESKEKDPLPDTSEGSLDKSALHDTRGGFDMYYGQRRRPISYKQDRISSSYLIPVRVPSSLKSKVRMSGRS